MQIRELYEYNELSTPECRICLDSETDEKGEFISPCVCAGSQKYIHRSCLNRWREGNREGRAFTHCEICKSKYIIKRNFELETWIIREKSIAPCNAIILYGVYLYGASFILWNIDYHFGYPSIIVPCLEDKHSLLCRFLPSNNTTLSIIYYMSWGSILTSAGFFLFMTGKSFCTIRRKCLYWKIMFPQLILHTAATANIFLIYIIYSFFNDINFYAAFLFLVTIHNIIFNMNYCRVHNKMILKMNTVLNQDRVLSLEDNTEIRENIIV